MSGFDKVTISLSFWSSDFDDPVTIDTVRFLNRDMIDVIPALSCIDSFEP